MKIRIEKDEILKGLQKTQNIAEKRTTMPVLSHILIETSQNKIRLLATDLEISFKDAYPAEIIKEGSAVISAKTFFGIVKGLSEKNIYIEKKKNNQIYISDGRTEYTIFGLAPSEFPSFPSYEDMHFISVESTTLKEMIEKTIYSIAGEELRYNLAGIYLERISDPKDPESKLRMVSTDGHRLSLIDKDVLDLNNIELQRGIIIPKKGVYEINRLLDKAGDVKLGIKENTLVIKRDEMVLAVRLLSGEFPDYNSVIPKSNDKDIKVLRNSLMTALLHVALLTSERFKGVQFNISDGKLDIVLENPDIGRAEEKVDIEYKGPDFQCAFNPRYFVEALECMKSEYINLSLYDQSSPCIITGTGDEGFLGLIMPMKLKEREWEGKT